jgi:hypothetical protein
VAYQICPKCGFQRRSTDTGDPGICSECGLVFAKWTNQVLGRERLPSETELEADENGPTATLLAQLTEVAPHTVPKQFWGRIALYVVLFLWGWHFILLDFRSAEIMHSFMHRIDLIFHEAGHIIFMPFGHFVMVLGGTLGQLLMPAIVCAAFVLKNQDNFAGSVGLWWLGQGFMDCAPYIADARALQLPLLGGGTGADRPGVHDWENILLDLNLINHDIQIGGMAKGIGTLLMLLAFVWGGYILLQQYRNLEH